MISCKCECIHNEHGECSKEDIVMGLSGCLSMIDKDKSTYSKVIEHFGENKQQKKLLEEMDELEYAICGYGIVSEEMADVLNMLEQMKIIFEISNEELHNIMTQKMQRTLARIEGEQRQ